MRIIKLLLLVCVIFLQMGCSKTEVTILMPRTASTRVIYAGGQLKDALAGFGYDPVVVTDSLQSTKVIGQDKGICISLLQASDTTGLKKEGFTITSDGNLIRVVGNDGTGVIYGCRELTGAENGYEHVRVDRKSTRLNSSHAT